MNEQILFRYGYTDGKNWEFKEFTLEDIENRRVPSGINFSYKLTTRDRWTGLTDKNGVKVFEGDELECDFYHASWWWYNNPQPTGHDGYSSVRGICSVNHFGEICKIRFTEYSFWFDEYKDLEDKINKYHLGTKINNNSNAFVIGNIHEKK